MNFKRNIFAVACSCFLWLANGRGWFDISAENDLASITDTTHDATGVIACFADLPVFKMKSIIIIGTVHMCNFCTVTDFDSFNSTDRHNCLGKYCIKFFEDRASKTCWDTCDTTLYNTTGTVLAFHTFLQICTCPGSGIRIWHIKCIIVDFF